METKNKNKKLSSFFPEGKLEKNNLFPNADFSTSMTTTQSIIFRPNNYRRQIEVKKRDNSTLKKIKVLYGAIPARHNKLINIKEFEKNITIQYGTSTLTAIYSQTIIGGHKETFLIERDSIEDLEIRIDEIKEDIRKKIDYALDRFQKEVKIRIPYKKPIWTRHEDFVKGEDFIDKIPRETVVHDTFFKKVYGKGIEFMKGEPTVHLKNYIKNRAVEDISPEIAKEINDFRNTTDIRLAEFAEQIHLHLEVLGKINKSFKRFNKLLSQKNIKEWL